MFLRNNKLMVIVALTSFSQVACYNTYFISQSELEKLESHVEPREVVEVLGDCPKVSSAYRSVALDGTQWAEVDPGESHVADDRTSAVADPSPGGCTRVPVSTANAVNVVTNDGVHHRVTPFNFVMSERQLVSPEYDLLLDLSDVEGAEVKEFSTWKTVATITGVSLVTIGTFVGISLLAPDDGDFE